MKNNLLLTTALAVLVTSGVANATLRSEGENKTDWGKAFEDNDGKYGKYYHQLASKDTWIAEGETFSGGEAKVSGGAVNNMTKMEIKNSTFSNNHVRGKTVTDPNKTLETSVDGGGALFVGSSSETTIENSTFSGNSSSYNGGAIATRENWKATSGGNQLTSNKNAKLTITDSTFINNESAYNGGALSNTFEQTSITGGSFSGNKATKNGGAIANFAGSGEDKGLTVTGATFEGNSAKENGGAIFNGGYDNQKVAVKVENSNFTNNTASSGGAIYSKGTESVISVTGGTFSNNQATGGNGGAIFSGSGNKLTVSGATFEGNHAKKDGGAISTDSHDAKITDTTFRNNSAEGKGGALNLTGADGDKVTFTGNVVFEGNYVTDEDGNKTLNDIYFGDDHGNIIVEKEASLTLDGGISCKGDSCTGAKLTLQKGSTLSVNNRTVIESATEVNGGDESEGQKANLKLRLAAGGEEKSFDLNETFKNGAEEEGGFSKLKEKLSIITDNNLYNIEETEKDSGKYTATQKSSSEVASILGVTRGDADTILGMMNAESDNETFSKVQSTLAEMAQLDKVDSEAVARSADALGADAAPVVQTRETMLANMIFDTANNALDDSLQNAAVGQSSGDNLFDKAKVWVKGLFNYADKDDTKKSHGFDIDTYGVAMGMDKEVGAGKVGLGYAYSESDIGGYTRDTDVDTHSVFVYGQYQPADWYVKGVAAYSWSDYKEKKSVLGENANAKYDVNTLALQGLYGYNFHVANGYDITPEGGLRYLRASQDSTTNGLGVRVKGRDIDVLTAVAGVKVAKNFALTDSLTIRPEVRAALTYDLKADDNDSVVTMGNTSFRMNGEKLDRFGAEFGAKLATDVTSNWEVAAGYEGRFRDDYQDHTGLISAKYKF